MNISKSNFRKIILLSVCLTLLSILLDVVVSVFVNYGHIESELSLGIIEKIPLWGLLAVTVLLFAAAIASMVLLYRFASIGRTLYTGSFIVGTFLVMFGGDAIHYSILYPLDYFISFLDIFIIYLIYFTPLKERFK